MKRIKSALNARPLREFESPPKVKTIVAAPMEKDNSPAKYHRAMVEEYTMEVVEIFFIDYGRISRVPSDDLRMIDDVAISRLSPLAFRCALASIRPSNEVANCQGRWSRASRDCFKALIRKSYQIYGEIYSVANSTVNLKLILVDKKERQLNMNEYLIENGHAISRKESFLSKYNHDLRVQLSDASTMPPEEKLFHEERQYDEDASLEVS